MNTRDAMEEVVMSMENQPTSNYQDRCDEILAHLQKANELVNHMAGSREVIDDGDKHQEPDGSIEKLGQQISDILKSVTVLTAKLDRIEKVI